MSTWNNVVIDAIIDVDTLPYVDAWRLTRQNGEIDDRPDFSLSEGEAYWEHIGGHVGFLRDADGQIQSDGNGGWLMDESTRRPNTQTACDGESKYRRDEIEAWCVEWTAANPGIKVEWSQSWDDDGPGESVDVYLNGELQRAESRKNALVPMDLEADVHAIRQLDFGTTQYRDAVNALLDALAPVRREVTL